MSATDSKLAPLSSTHDLKLACTQCSVKEKEVTYTLKSVLHQCACNLLLCRAKGGSKWRPVSRRPMFSNPSQYQMCHFYVEGLGCTSHKNRCTFARSAEEATVWTFLKHHGLDHMLLCNLIAQSERGTDPPGNADPLGDLLSILELKAVCDQCFVNEKEMTYIVQSISHKCSRDLLLARGNAHHQWRPVSERPTGAHIGRNVLYQVCRFNVEGSVCTEHGPQCTFARSSEEAVIWNLLRDRRIDKGELIRLVIESERMQTTPESAAESIRQQFSGEFMELCRECFHDCPQKLTFKKWNSTCSADSAHSWDPVLVHHLSENSRKHVYSQVRPFHQNCQLTFCTHVRQGKPCWHQPGHCSSAQSEVEMAVWKAEEAGHSVRPHLLRMSQGEQTEHRKKVTMYCKVCLLILSSPESFYKHCSSLEHSELLREDTTTRWKGRPPPHNHRSELWLCERPQTCEYGSKCPKAHSVEELQEWLMRAEEEKEIRHNIGAQGLMCYNENLLQEYKNTSNEVYIVSEEVDGVSISCDKELAVQWEQINAPFQWNFKVESERQLVHVALLKQEPGASFTLGELGSVPCIYSSGVPFLSEDMTYDITVSFTSINPGLYDQWLVLDFDTRPVLLKKLRVRVGQLSLDDVEQPTLDAGAPFQSVERWHRGSRVIIPCTSRTEEQEELLKEYKPPQISFQYKSSINSQTPLSNENYKERMHNFLHNEERAEDQIVSRLNVRGKITTCDRLNSTKFSLQAPAGELFCAVSIPCNLTPDTPEGQALKRSIQSALIAPLSSHSPKSKVYEAIILQDQTSENEMHLQLSKKCCSDLALRSDDSYPMEVQFQLDRHSFCSMHKAVDLLPDTKRVLPDLPNCIVPVNNISCEKLNAKQLSAVNFITGRSNGAKCVAPLLIYGPFGTGKTFTLATAARELCKQPHNKVLICTHTNSSADLYVRDHLHPFIDQKNNEMWPIRIKANSKSGWFATDEITRKYCLLSQDGQFFLPPTKAALDGHKIVITTTTMARRFHDLKLPEGYFTHILIDEASQMLECEALMALGLAGPNTRVALAGDHMQMGPKLFSVDDHHRSNHTLLNRLFHYYQGQKCDAAERGRIIFNENYRSSKEIVEFVSTHFYVGQNDVIKAVGNVPAPENGHALKFHHVRGECLLDSGSLSWYNQEEVRKVVEEVKEILKDWPMSWGTKKLSSICILSEGNQVRHIRTSLSRRGLSEVHVENLANVQGKQFRAVILTAVQTRDSLRTSHLPGLELFNDARVLNTAMTRAQSLVVVVGDAAALCCFGKCSAVWKSYIDHCISNNSVSPQHYAQDFFEKDVMETARFQKSEQVDERNTLSDAILRELTDEYKQLKEDINAEEGDFGNHQSTINQSRSSHNVSDVNNDLLALCEKCPQVYQIGKFVRETERKGYVVPFHNPAERIIIKGRENLKQIFSGDEVMVESSRVICITKEAKSARKLVCFLEDEDHSKSRQNSDEKYVRRTMIPITRSAPKICILISKKRRDFLPIWEQTGGEWFLTFYEPLDDDLKQNYVFVVQVIGWKANCHIPLGNVIRILPIGSSFSAALQILNEEFKVAPNTCESDSVITFEDEDSTHRKDVNAKFTFTVDPEHARDLDDAISVMEIGDDEFELGVHIADVASYVSKNCKLDCDSKQRGATYYENTNCIHMFPKDATEHFSLLPGEGRRHRVVSLIFKVKKTTNEIIGEPKFQLSSIESNRKLSYEKAGDMITKRYRDIPRFDSIEDCVTVAYCFAKAQRMLRPVDWVYSQRDDDRLPGKRKANLMIEELSLLFNTHASKYLMNSEETMHCTPLRCQAKPNPERIEEFKKKCGGLISLSFHVKDRIDVEEAPNCENFRILTEVWKDIQAAARSDDVDSMVDLIAADDIHPLLQPVIDQFRRCQSRAEVLCSKSSAKAQQGHYSLNLTSYTQASSPIRRYMDVIAQRLLHSIICNRKVQYNTHEIKTLCGQFEENVRAAKEYEQKAEQVRYAVTMKHQSAPNLAFVVSPNKDHLAVAFPFNRNAYGERVSIAYKDLQLCDQPVFDEANNCVTLKWKRRIYAVDNMQIHQELKMSGRDPCVELPLAVWKDIIEAVHTKDWDHAKSLTIEADTKRLEELQFAVVPHSETNDKLVEQEHEVAIEVQLQSGDTLQVQMTAEIKRGYHMPAVQLVCIKPKFEICVHHVRSSITCFTRSADNPSRIFYSDPEEYVRIWKPMCEMESVANAVGENYSITIENLEVNFSKGQEGTLSGSFFLPAAWIDQWAIECNLWKCLLCIRKRGLTVDSAPVDSRPFTWVAHCLTRKVTKRKKPPNEGSTVHFDVHQLAMETIPHCVYGKNTCFTVEIIPKLIPDIRKEDAVLNIPSACDLVKTIALGKHIPREVEPSWHRPGRDSSAGLLDFNISQRHAVEKALNHTFTLIQGPPGTGKTVVGAYIVFRFFELNSLYPRKLIDESDENKKQVILYCGPSNKSVDVIAEHLLKFGDRLRPLRVYSEQVEMLDYNFPDSALQFSQRPHRQQRGKEELKSITLHHRMRQDQNPFSGDIKEFDERIRDAIENKKQFTAEEVKEYKDLLTEARKFELQQHDIILCTCTQSSNKTLTSTLCVRQIIIDECAMATEPQALIPLACNKPEKIVLIGDHKQLRPIVKHERVRRLGMAKSLFERYYTMHKSRAVMLDTQYRMHDNICAFPSQEFYEGKLKTGEEQPRSVLRVDNKTMPIVFGDIIGETVSLVVNTAKGNENSKANKEERVQAVKIAMELVENAGIKQHDIVILTPYNAQVSEIQDELKENQMDRVAVTTITKSQGSEWRYVILSTVCSLPIHDIEKDPDRAWLSKHLGFVGDANQINVGITRAKEGLCIIGNQQLLSCSRIWGKLIGHYRLQNAVTEASNISVSHAEFIHDF
ncbi:helicase with zinc finger domain 2-like isoform X1 [Pungitius pungitius]|uniref:helicase with zinc finger domain 2-like isoform X1 n=1 Tax=Pungitius pungitius TaxID=134920 RepID=UPI002E12D161